MHLCGVHYSGEFTIGEETYSVEPVEETLSGVHRVYRESDSVLETHICGICSLLSSHAQNEPLWLRWKNIIRY